MKRYALVLLALAVFASARPFPPDRAGPFTVKVERVAVPLATGLRVSLLYSPVAESGSLPCVVLAHGFLAPIGRYDSICRRLASHGFHVLVPGFPDYLVLFRRTGIVRDLLAALDHLDSLARRPGSRLDPARVALVGHSIGGGAAFLAARRSRKGRVVAVAALSPGSVADTTRPENLRVPVLVVAAGNDRTAPPGRVRRDFYEPSRAPKHYVLVRSGGHNGYLDHTNWLEDRLERFDRAVQLRVVRTCLTAFLRYYVAGDRTAEPWLSGPPQDDTTIEAEYE